jgi:uncharacterized membrane protein YphA (DoxX/SURF4 family)/peroxiredoxin
MKLLTKISRIFVGVLFIISGFIKANDPLGFSYKLQDYYEVFGEYWLLQLFNTPLFHQTALEFSMFICILEIVLGVALLIGAFARKVSWTLIVLIVFFTFLTGFSAITGSVTDCGCFGDAVKLTPWQSFMKDLVLLFFILIIFINRDKIKPVFTSKKATSLIMGAGVLFPLIFTVMAYNHLPFIDFRPYKIGNDICEMRVRVPDVTEFIYVLKNKANGETKEFQKFPDNYENEWDFIEMKTIVLEEGIPPKLEKFNISDEDGNEFTDDFLNMEGLKFLLIAYDIGKTKTSEIKSITDLQMWAESKGIPFFGISASSDRLIEEFRHLHNAAFPFLSADETELKTIIRSNPGLVLFDGCKIVGKWHWRDIPTGELIESNFINP